MRTFVFCILIIFFAIPAQGRDFTANEVRQIEAAVEQAINQLSTPSSNVQHASKLRTLFATWRNVRNDDSLVNLTDEIDRVSRESGTMSVVTISATRGNGAIVKYQTYGEHRRGDPIRSAGELTTANERMYMGLYFIWCERDGAITSDENRLIPISSTQANVTLQER